jgi:hypothetical protein
MVSVWSRGVVLSVFAATALVGTLLACAREPLTLGAGETTENPGFALPDASNPPVTDAGLDASTPPDAPLMCVATECPAPLATCPRRDGTLPDYACTTDLSNDVLNCGACNAECRDTSPRYNVIMTCVTGECRAICKPGFFDCNGIPDDGCEADTSSDDANCGACGVQCAPGQKCFDFGGSIACGCKPGQTLCKGGAGLGDYCTDTENDPSNCGACGYECPFSSNSAPPVCQNGRCKTECVPGTADCNGRDDDGCESDVSHDPRNCGGCGVMCDLAAGQPCIGGRCLTKDCSGTTTQ